MRDRGAADPCPHCGRLESTPAESPLQLAPRTLLQGRYLLGRVLGQGGFGITYLAWDLDKGGKLAIKEYFPLAISTRAEDRISVSAISAKSRPDLEYGLKKFAEEGQALAKFKESPGIVSMVDFFYANGTAYIVMLYVEGRTFKQYLEARAGRISFEEGLKIIALVMNALEEVHAAGMLHRDISPDNIYVEDDGQTKILDFGATRYAMGEQSQSLSVILKPGYAPEEQYRSKGRQGPWTDIYALGATFYRGLTSHTPPEAPDRLAQDELIPPSRYGIRMPPHSEAALLKALAVRYENRFKTVAEFRRAMGVRTGTGPGVMARSPGEAAAPGRGIARPPAPVDAASRPLLNLPRVRLSKAFYVLSAGGGLGLVILFSLVTPQSIDDVNLLVFYRVLAFVYAAIVMMVFLHKAWTSIQDGRARMSPGQAIGFLFVPFYNIYWLFQVFWGFSRDYNRLVERHVLGLPKLPEGLFLASNITYTILIFSAWVQGWFQFVALVNLILLCAAVWKACGAVNALSGFARAVAIKPQPPVAVQVIADKKRMRLRCVLGEFQGDDLELENGEVFIGRNPREVNWVFSSDEISGRHVRVWRDAAQPAVWVEDMNSTNGTFYREPSSVNGQWVRLSGCKLLPAGSRFRLGQDLAEFEVNTV
jgi:hypothetical protein